MGILDYITPGKPPETNFKKVKIEWLKSKGQGIAQIYGSGLEYALVNKAKEQCHNFVFCKDFIQDVIHGHLYGRTASIYNFHYDPKTMPALDLDRLRIVLVNQSDNKFADKIPHVLDFVNQFCKRLKLKPTKVFQVSNPPSRYTRCGAFFFSGSGMWANAPVFVSMYSLLLRVGFIHETGRDCMQTIKMLVDGKLAPYQSNDRTQMSSSLKGVEKILKLGYRQFFYIDTKKNYPQNANVSTMHNSTGIQSFAQGATSYVCPYWTRKSIGKKKKVKVEEVPTNQNDLAEEPKP
jgi:hypothetical protein